jgi:hypothetical protein
MTGTTTTVNPNVFAPSGKVVDLEEAVQPGPTMDLDGKLEEENFGQAINENVSLEEVSTPLTKKPANTAKKK